jgi:hypothetical protein
VNKILYGFIFILISASSLSAYEKVFDAGTKVLSAGVMITGVYDGYGDTVLPPLNISFDYGVKFRENVPVSFGGMIAYARDSYDIGNSGDKCYYDYYFLGFRSAFHFTEMLKVDYLDLYAGIIAGHEFVNHDYSSSGSSYNPKGSRFIAGGYGGARYYLTNNIAAFSEIGLGGLGFLNVGVAYKF